MIDALLELVPTYGVWLIFVSVLLSCLALPVPSSLLVMAAGGFAAAGDIDFAQLVLFAFLGFLLGDQVAFAIARTGGAPLVERLRARRHAAGVIDSAGRLIERRGTAAVFLSRTVMSPIGPYVAFLSGALRLDWARFTAAAALGAAFWSVGYASLGYLFAGHIAEIADLISTSLGLILSLAAAAGLLAWLVHRYRAEATGTIVP